MRFAPSDNLFENVKKYGNTQNEHIFCSLNWDFFLHY